MFHIIYLKEEEVSAHWPSKHASKKSNTVCKVLSVIHTHSIIINHYEKILKKRECRREKKRMGLEK